MLHFLINLLIKLSGRKTLSQSICNLLIQELILWATAQAVEVIPNKQSLKRAKKLKFI